ncbi:MAG: mercuric reductase [Kofleriaceae bacterium]|nr:mercuric reductase [Kofleriaceae bacterium]
MNESSADVLVLPDDQYNRALVKNVHPANWQNPTPNGRYNMVVIGGGAAGLICAIGAAGMGAKVALIERHLLGGDCLNFGCVPSKSLIRIARAIHDARSLDKFGGSAESVSLDFGDAMKRMRRLRAQLSVNDSAQRFADLGVDVFIGDASFVSKTEIVVGDQKLSFARAVIATSARARAASIPGLNEAGFLTNVTVFSLTELPKRLVVVGAGPIGCELAQASSRMGSEVTIIGREPDLLPREDPDAAAVLSDQFGKEGIQLLLGTDLTAVKTKDDGSKLLLCKQGGNTIEVAADEILLSIGRVPNTEGLGLEQAGVKYDRRGVIVSDKLRTSNRRIYAAGDICSRYQFTQAADAMARIVIQNALFFGRKKVSSLVIPWCTYTDPEIAHVGITSTEAQRSCAITQTVQLASMDRALLDGETAGFARVHVDPKKGRILGATLVATHAGEMIAEMSLAMTTNQPLGTLARTIHPYPTQSEVWKRLGDQWNRKRFTPFIAKLFKRWLAWIR